MVSILPLTSRWCALNQHIPARRQVLKFGAATLGLLSLVNPIEALGMLRPTPSLGDLDFQALRDEIGAQLFLRAEGGSDTVSARISAVVEHHTPTPQSPFQQYSMFLESRGATSLGQGVHRVTHRVHGASDLLVVPVVHDQMRIQNSDMQQLTVYQITFTRAISA